MKNPLFSCTIWERKSECKIPIHGGSKIMNITGIIEIVVTVPTGIVCIVLGLLLWKKQKIQLVHDYHHKNVQPQDIKAYTKLWGNALIILGICVCPTGIIDYTFCTWIGWVLFGAGLAFCFIIGNKVQKKYNGSWFS